MEAESKTGAPHRVPWCGLLLDPCTRSGWVLSSIPSRPHRSACPECSHTGQPQSHSVPGETTPTNLQQEDDDDDEEPLLRQSTLKHTYCLYLFGLTSV